MYYPSTLKICIKEKKKLKPTPLHTDLLVLTQVLTNKKAGKIRL